MSNKQAILFLSGLWVSQYIWEQWSVPLSRAGYYADRQVYGEDFCHFRGSLPQYINFVIRLCHQIKEDTNRFPIIFGHSMGGLVAQAVATQIPIPKVVLISSAAPSGISNLSWPLGRKMLPYLPAIISGRQFRPSKQDARELIFSQCVDQMGHYGIAKSSGIVARQSIMGSIKLPSLSCPCLVVAGDRDRILLLDVQHKLAAKHDADMIIGPYGHMPMLEDRDQTLIKLIINWMSKTSDCLSERS